MKNKVVPSEQTQQEAMKIAKATQKPGQTKEQTKLIAQGIEKGIAQYKKQQKERSRQADKAKKKAQKAQKAKRSVEQMSNQTAQVEVKNQAVSAKPTILPWALLIISWIGFIAYVSQN